MDTITFGKHKGLSRTELLEKYPSYALWAHTNVSFFTLAPFEIQQCIAATDNPYAGFGGPDDEEDWSSSDSYGGMSYSDFGNN